LKIQTFEGSTLKFIFLFLCLGVLVAKILWIYNLKEGSPSWEVLISINFGILEYWSSGVMAKELMAFLSTLQYAITPVLRFSRTFGNLKITFLWVIVPNFFKNSRF